MMTDTVPNTLCDAAILEARRIARDDSRHLVVGLEELPDGTGRFGHMTESDARFCPTFIAGWLVTPEGEILTCRAPAATMGGAVELSDDVAVLEDAGANHRATAGTGEVRLRVHA